MTKNTTLYVILSIITIILHTLYTLPQNHKNLNHYYIFFKNRKHLLLYIIKTKINSPLVGLSFFDLYQL